jgi:hypothetical protein
MIVADSLHASCTRKNKQLFPFYLPTYLTYSILILRTKVGFELANIPLVAAAVALETNLSSASWRNGREKIKQTKVQTQA